ncbi:7SK snRNA methylphosphate capping enzyme [Biomphalaria pfeifferi]|uniref:7SK snRNA methylphosphate capping enzyme n=1 Tax=Biomphalaria pfeifferi TaxID=112525 RepID=A0AAD8ATM1_BIOPF|nr:7SK snRNA methylphosphate capping enzyme [Biomphalaria pfeifferi]
MVLDVGCGDGMSMMPLLNLGHHCVGVDIKLQSLVGFKNDLDDKECLLNIQNNVSLWSQTTSVNANTKLIGNEKDKLNMCNSSMFDLVRWDLRYGLPFKENSFDLVISVSFLQWLFYGPWQKQLESFFGSLRKVVALEGKTVIQFYPASVNQVENTIDIAMKYFKGVLVGDYPHIDRGRKLFLILF